MASDSSSSEFFSELLLKPNATFFARIVASGGVTRPASTVADCAVRGAAFFTEEPVIADFAQTVVWACTVSACASSRMDNGAIIASIVGVAVAVGNVLVGVAVVAFASAPRSFTVDACVSPKTGKKVALLAS